MKKIHLSKRYFYIAGLLLTVLLFLLTGQKMYTHITVDYAMDPTGEAIVSAYGEDGVLAETVMEDGHAELFFWGNKITGIAPIHYDTKEELYLTNLEIHVHGNLVLKADAEQFADYFSPNEDIQSMKVKKAGVEIITHEEHPLLLPTEELTKAMNQTAKLMSLLNLAAYLLLYHFVYWYLFVLLKIQKDHSYQNLIDAALGLIGIAALLLSWGIAFSSPYGGTVHPDEMQTRAAVDYYRTHWIQPDVRSEFVAGTVSGYGMTRMSEINLYYLFAGKIANLCVFEMSFRAMGMLLMLILTFFILKNIKKERYLAILFFATPQLWYLFSYATSDAYDYFFTVLATYEILSEKSALNRILKDPWKAKQIPAYLGIGFIFANLLMGKKTFYVVLATIFLMLLYRLIFEKREVRKALLAKYMGILAISFAIVLIRYAPDFGYYGLHKGAAVDQVIETTALYEYKPSTPAIKQAKSTLLYEKGVSLKEFFKDWNFNGELFKNYFGYYGIYSLEAKDWYYILMAVIYLILFGTLGVLNYRKMKQCRMEGGLVTQEKLTYWTMWGMILLMYLLTIYNAYFVDFQPQGRYLFPALPALACQIGLYREVSEHKAVRALMLMLAVVSLYSFYKIAYLNF